MICAPRAIPVRSLVGLVFAVVGLVAVPRPSLAQAPPSAADLTALRQRLDAIEQTMQAQLAALRQQIVDLETGQPTELAPAPGQVVQSPVVAATAQQDSFGRERESVARVDNRPIDPAMQGFVAIPGTPARVKLDGYAKLDTIVDTNPAGNPDQFLPGTIPVGLSDAERVVSSTLHVRQTRLNLDFRSPTDFGTDFRTFAEIDFYGTSGPVDPRMRHFYGQLANVLIGQTWTSFTDPDAFPDMIDIAGPAGVSLLRQAQVRYTQPLGARQSLAFAIERPLTQAPQTAEGGSAYSPAPDVIARYRLIGARGHLQLGGLARALGYRVEARNATTLGIGANASGAWKATERDLLIGYVAYGAGIARYIDNLAGMDADLDRDDRGTDVAALPALGTYAAITHQWPKRFRSTAVVGYSQIDNTAAQAASAIRSSVLRRGQPAVESGRVAQRRRRVPVRDA